MGRTALRIYANQPTKVRLKLYPGDVNICLGAAGSSYGSGGGDPALARAGPSLTAPDSDNKHGNFPDLVNLGTDLKWRQLLYCFFKLGNIQV